jgi:hypothetical protein
VLTVTNKGDTYLNSIRIADNELNFTQTVERVLAPNDFELISIAGKIPNTTTAFKNTATVTANPILVCGTDITGIPDVVDDDWSAVEKLSFTGSVKVLNTVYLGHDGGQSCAKATKSIKELYGANVTYCFQVQNTGTSHLRSVTVANAILSFNAILNQTLAPNAFVTLTFPSTIMQTRTNIVNVSGTPVTSNGIALMDLSIVKASDSSGVEVLSHAPKIALSNMVYRGNDGGKSCASAGESVQDQYGTNVTFCMKVSVERLDLDSRRWGLTGFCLD